MSNEKIQAGLEKYNASVEKAISRFPERPHLPEQRLYTPLDIKDTDYADEIGFPGMYPYTRGVQPTMAGVDALGSGKLPSLRWHYISLNQPEFFHCS